MIRLNGIIDNLTSPVKVKDKSVVNLSLIQKEEGYASEVIKMQVWSDAKCFDTATKLGEGQQVEIMANVAAEKRNGAYTGNVRFYPSVITAL